MTIFRIERLSPIETQKHCISNSLKYNASLHFVYRHVDIITLLSTFAIRHTLREFSIVKVNSGRSNTKAEVTLANPYAEVTLANFTSLTYFML